LNFDTTVGAERAAAEQPSIPLNAMEEMYLRENRSGPPRRAVPPTPLEYGPPRRLPIREAEAPVNPMLEFQENFDYQGPPARVPSLPAVSPEGLQETIDAGRVPVNPMLEFQENFDYQGPPARGPAPGVDTGTPLQIPPGGVQELLPPPRKTDTPVKDRTMPTGPTGVPANAQMTDNERMLNQDKWLALARVGLGLMASQAPTFGQALGESGMAGVEALQSARKDYVERKQAEELLALRRAAAASKGKESGLSISNIISLREDLVNQVDSLTKGALGRPLPESALIKLQQLNAQISGIDRLLGLDAFGALGAATSGADTAAVTRLPSAGG
jgi:hypothetical protein